MTVLTFVLTLYTEFRVGSAYGRDGVDLAIDHHDPLPADHLKGVMRDAAQRLLGREHPVVRAVFGSTATPSPWAWTSATPATPKIATDTGWSFGHRHRVSIDSETHSAMKDLLVLGEQAWAESPRFTVQRIRSIVAPDPRGLTEADHVLLLRAAAAGVHGLGSWRRRGLGWVGVIALDGPVTSAEVERLLAWREATR